MGVPSGVWGMWLDCNGFRTGSAGKWGLKPRPPDMSSGTVRTVSDRHSETSRVSEPFRGKRPQQPNARLRPPFAVDTVITVNQHFD
jgi:hypothetical protein